MSSKFLSYLDHQIIQSTDFAILINSAGANSLFRSCSRSLRLYHEFKIERFIAR